MAYDFRPKMDEYEYEAKVGFSVDTGDGDFNIHANGVLIAWFRAEDGKLVLMSDVQNSGLPTDAEGCILIAVEED